MTISYVEQPSPFIRRQRELKNNYHFDCSCTRCADDQARLAAHRHGTSDAETALRAVQITLEKADATRADNPSEARE